VPLEYVTVKRSKRASSGVGAARYSRTISAHNNAVAARHLVDGVLEQPHGVRPVNQTKPFYFVTFYGPPRCISLPGPLPELE
jgi:hypothetical protein